MKSMMLVIVHVTEKLPSLSIQTYGQKIDYCHNCLVRVLLYMIWVIKCQPAVRSSEKTNITHGPYKSLQGIGMVY